MSVQLTESEPWGAVDICDEIRAIVPKVRIQEHIAHLRFGGATAGNVIDQSNPAIAIR